MRALLLSLSPLSLALLAGCWSEPPYLSTDVSTRDMAFQAEVIGDDARTTVKASLVGPGGAVRLLDGDRLSLRAEGVEVPLLKGPEGSYEATIGPGIVDLALALDRDAPDESAMLSLPMPPLSALSVDPMASRQAPLVITWTPGDGLYQSVLSVTGTCITPASRDLSVDPGTYSFQPADLASGSAETCQVTVTLQRSRQGQEEAPPLKTSYFAGSQIMIATLLSTP